MRLSLRDSFSLSGGSQNEDRVGQIGTTAWVIDGATDVLEVPLLPGPSDATWFADALNHGFMKQAAKSTQNLEDIVEAATSEVRARFEEVSLRPAIKTHERPSAASILIRVAGDEIEALGLGDCTLLALSEEKPPFDIFQPAERRVADAEIRSALAEVRSARSDAPQTGPQGIRAELLPVLRAARDRMNQPGGYGVFSIDLPPAEFFLRASRPTSTGDQFLLATDGFMRLVDLYGAYSLTRLGEAIRNDGLAHLLLALRKIETEDADCLRFVRAKAMDDATAMIVEVVD